MNTSLIRKIIASDLPRKEQDIMILLVAEYDSVSKGEVVLDSYYRENEPEHSEGESDPEEEEEEEEEQEEEQDEEQDKEEEEEKDSEGAVKHEDCDDLFNQAVRSQYEARHRRAMNGSELAAHDSAQRSIKCDHSKAWGLQFPSHTIWGNWVHSYDK